MLAQCVNPNCRAALRSFSEGRLFQFEVVSISVAARDDSRLPFDEKPKRQTSHFWLCGECSTKLSVTLEPMTGLRLVPLPYNDTHGVDDGGVSCAETQAQASHC